MNISQRGLIMQRWGVVQRELMPELRSEIGAADIEARESNPHAGMGADRRDKLMI